MNFEINAKRGGIDLIFYVKTMATSIWHDRIRPKLINYGWVKYLMMMWSLRLGISAFSLLLPTLSAVVWNFYYPTIFPLPLDQIDVISWDNNLESILSRGNNFPYVVDQIFIPRTEIISSILISELSENIKTIKYSETPNFLHFSNDRHWSSGYNMSSKYRIIEMARSSFFDSLHSLESQGYYYLNQPLHKHNYIVQGFAPFFLQIQNQYGFDPAFHLWISTPNVTASPHYDMENNFFLQLNGTKTFFIATPDHLESFATYSSLHPYWRQSRYENINDVKSFKAHIANQYCLKQILSVQQRTCQSIDDVENSDQSSCQPLDADLNDLITHTNFTASVLPPSVRGPFLACTSSAWSSANYSESGLYEISLSRGQMLFLPSMHIHAVKTGMNSLSLNAWMGSKELYVANQIAGSAFPFESQSSITNKLSDFRLAIQMILKSNFRSKNIIKEYSEYFSLRYPPTPTMCAEETSNNIFYEVCAAQSIIKKG